MDRRLLAVLLLFGLSGPCLADDESLVAKPDVKAGDTWKYRHTDSQQKHGPVVFEFKVTFVGPNAVEAVSVLPNGNEIDTTWTPEWNAVTDARSGSFFPHSGLFKFPLKPGTTYQSQYEVVRPRQNTFDSKNTVHVKVLGWEQVSVPAGTFRALRIEATGTTDRLDKRNPGFGALHTVVWYVPELKRWAKRIFETMDRRGRPARHDSEELLEYHLQ